MQLKTNNLKFITKVKHLILSMCFLMSFTTMAQEIIQEKKKETKKEEKKSNDGRMKVDGVAAVVGDFVILESDIDKQYEMLSAGGVNTDDITRCELFGKLLEDKLYIHHAIQDSIEVNDIEVRAQIDQQINMFAEQIGSMEKLVAYYKKSSEKELRDEMYALNKNNKMAALMQQNIVEDVEVTPEEVRQFYNKNLKEDPPVFGTELKIAQIVVVPETSEAEVEKVINQLKSFKADVIDNGASFTTKAVLYTEDTASKKNGGRYTLNRKRPQMVKEFREVAFSLEEGEISDPFKTDFGYHIIHLERIRGQEYDVQHILMRPKVTQAAIDKAKADLENARQRILDGSITFADAALEISDEKETKFDGGQLRNPDTQDYSFELTKMDPEIYSQVQNLKDGEVSLVLEDGDRVNPVKFKILTVTDRIDEHKADFAKDYLKIKSLTLEDKRIGVIQKWQEEKIMDTYIKLNGEHRSCEFKSNWLKKSK